MGGHPTNQPTGPARPADRHQPLAEEKKPGIRKKKKPRIVIPEGPVPGGGKKTRNSKEKNARIVIPEGQGHPTNQPTGLARPEDRHQPLAKEKKTGIRKKKNPRIVLPEGPVPGKGKKTRNSKEKKPANRT